MSKCGHCKTKYKPEFPMQKGCSFDCRVILANAAVEKARAKREAAQKKRIIDEAKEYKRETARRKKAFLDNDVGHWTKKAVFSCNRFVRERDRFEPCISCDATEAEQWDAGHFVPAGRGSAVRFDADRNIHRQCCSCNDGNKRSGNLIGYRPRLVVKIGLEAVEELERIGHTTKRWTVEELKAIVADYDKRFADLTRERAFA